MDNTTRDLHALEKDLLLALLEGNWRGRGEARGQIESARHRGRWFEGSPSFDILADPALPPLDVVSGILPESERDVVIDDELVGGVMLWVVAGRIDSLEYFWFTERVPSELPLVSELHPSSFR